MLGLYLCYFFHSFHIKLFLYSQSSHFSCTAVVFPSNIACCHFIFFRCQIIHHSYWLLWLDFDETRGNNVTRHFKSRPIKQWEGFWLVTYLYIVCWIRTKPEGNMHLCTAFSHFQNKCRLEQLLPQRLPLQLLEEGTLKDRHASQIFWNKKKNL